MQTVYFTQILFNQDNAQKDVQQFEFPLKHKQWIAQTNCYSYHNTKSFNTKYSISSADLSQYTRQMVNMFPSYW